jgi:hypothetical protein
VISFYRVPLSEHIPVNFQVGFCHIGERDLKDPSLTFYFNSVLRNPQESPFKLAPVLNGIDGLHFDQTVAIFHEVLFSF